MKIRLGSQGCTLVVLSLVSLLGEVDYQIIPPLLPLLAMGFQVDPGYVGRAVPVYSFSAGVSSLFFGYLSDQLGRKPFIQLALIGFSAAALLSYRATSAEFFFSSRLLMGMTAGGLATYVTSYAADFFQYKQRGRAMGILSSTYFMAATVGVPLATFIAGGWGWRPLYLINSGAALLMALVVTGLIEGQPFSVRQESTSPYTLTFRRAKEGLVFYLRRRDTLATLLASLLSSGAIVGFITYLGSHLNSQMRVPIQQVGMIFLWCGLASLIGAPLSGILSDRWGKKPVLVLSGMALAICLVVIPHFSLNVWLFGSLGLAGLSMAFRMAPLLAIMTELVNPRERGTLLALRTSLSQLGIAASTFTCSYCYLYGGYQVVGLFTAGLIVLATFLILFLVREPDPSRARAEKS
jgi:predicted MFS family arabinose efflux permease